MIEITFLTPGFSASRDDVRRMVIQAAIQSYRELPDGRYEGVGGVRVSQGTCQEDFYIRITGGQSDTLGDAVDKVAAMCPHYNSISDVLANFLPRQPVIQAQIAPGFFLIHTMGKTPDGTSCMSVDCPDYDAYKALPPALAYNNVIYGKTGWNSDIDMAYYQSNARLAKVTTTP